VRLEQPPARESRHSSGFTLDVERQTAAVIGLAVDRRPDASSAATAARRAALRVALARPSSWSAASRDARRRSSVFIRGNSREKMTISGDGSRAATR